MSYLSENGDVFPSLIGEEYSIEQRDQLAEFLVNDLSLFVFCSIVK